MIAAMIPLIVLGDDIATTAIILLLRDVTKLSSKQRRFSHANHSGIVPHPDRARARSDHLGLYSNPRARSETLMSSVFLPRFSVHTGS